jgi:hypothetical protein
MEQRHDPRIHFRELSADACDSKDFFRGKVRNVSRYGLCLADLPEEVDERNKLWSLLIKGKDLTCKIAASPRWSVTTGGRKMVGLEVMDPPLPWTDFLIDISLLIELHSKKQNRGQGFQ